MIQQYKLGVGYGSPETIYVHQQKASLGGRGGRVFSFTRMAYFFFFLEKVSLGFFVHRTNVFI